MNALEIKHLKKYYGRRLILDDINLTIPSGVVFALLGPNGAGKTTLLKSILNITKVTEGSIRLFDVESRDSKSHKRLAYFPEKFNFFPYFTVDGVLSFYAKAYGVEANKISSEIEEVLRRLDILPLIKRKINKISKGELQRVGIAAVLLSRAELYIFDEPFYGLDPIGIKMIKDIFAELTGKNKTVFINSHILGEIEKIANQIGIINKGKILYSGSVQQFIGDKNLEDSFYYLIKGE